MRINRRVVSDMLTGAVLERDSYEHMGKIARAMGVRLFSVFTNTFIGPLPANATETVVLTSPPVSQAVDNAAVLLFWFYQLLGGTAITAALTRIRRGTTTGGAQVGQSWNAGIGAGANNVISGCYFDTPGVVAGQQYSLTLSQTSATGAGTWVDGCLLAVVL